MLNCRLVVDVGSDFDSLNFAPFRLPYPGRRNCDFTVRFYPSFAQVYNEFSFVSWAFVLLYIGYTRFRSLERECS